MNSLLSAPCLIWPHRATYKAGLPGTKETFLFQVLIVKSAESQAACRDKASGMNKYYAAGTATFCCVKADKSRNKAANYKQTKTGPTAISTSDKSAFICRQRHLWRTSSLVRGFGFGLGGVPNSLCIQIASFFFGVQFLVVQHRGQIASRCAGPVVASLASYISHFGAEPWLGSGVILSRKVQRVLTAWTCVAGTSSGASH